MEIISAEVAQEPPHHLAILRDYLQIAKLGNAPSLASLTTPQQSLTSLPPNQLLFSNSRFLNESREQLRNLRMRFQTVQVHDQAAAIIG